MSSLIEVKHLKKYYNKGEIKALDDVSVNIERGDVMVVIGPSGSGKSTLLRSLNLLEVPTAGEIDFDGVDITKKKVKNEAGKWVKLDLDKHRQKMGMVFQHFNLFPHMTILDNMTLAPIHVKHMPKAEAEQKAHALLERVGLGDRAEAYPIQLSGGQKQRVAIARALATKPKYLLCDEATSALDPTTTQAILALLKQINRTLGVTIVVITHEMRVIEQICDRVAVIDQSRIAEIGKVSEVFVNPQSDIAKALIIPNNPVASLPPCEGRRLRLVFDNRVSGEPIISRIAMDCHVPVNIVFADTRFVEGNAYGHMILELPNDERQIQAVLRFLDANHINYEED